MAWSSASTIARTLSSGPNVNNPTDWSTTPMPAGTPPPPMVPAARPYPTAWAVILVPTRPGVSESSTGKITLTAAPSRGSAIRADTSGGASQNISVASTEMPMPASSNRMGGKRLPSTPSATRPAANPAQNRVAPQLASPADRARPTVSCVQDPAPARRLTTMTIHRSGARARPSQATALRVQPPTRRPEVPSRPVSGPLVALARKYAIVKVASTSPRPASGAPNEARMYGQATPSAPAGSPSVTKVRSGMLLLIH